MHSKEVSGPVYPDIPVEKNHITFIKLIKITESWRYRKSPHLKSILTHLPTTTSDDAHKETKNNKHCGYFVRGK